MVLPVLATYAINLPSANASLIGVALGIYGITQAVLQIPFGIWSDKIGRKPVIYLGLSLFALGAVIAANATSIWWIIVGRALQGSGAISAAVMALVSDLTNDENRTKAMAIIGSCIGLSFAVSLVLGPIIANWFGLSGIFWLTSILALSGMLILAYIIPNKKPSSDLDADINPNSFINVLLNVELLRLNLGIFVLHAVLMATFLVIPLVLINEINLDKNHHWQIYLATLITGFAAMLPIMLYGEKKRQLKLSFVIAIVILLSGELFFYFFHYDILQILFAMFLFFMAFNLLEAMLPSLISKISPAGSKGTAMGVYATCQFLGTALGGIGAGFILQKLGINAVIIFCLCLVGAWLIIAAFMLEPPYVTSIKIVLSKNNEPNLALHTALNLTGVRDAIIADDLQSLYIKYDNKVIKIEDIRYAINKF